MFCQWKSRRECLSTFFNDPLQLSLFEILVKVLQIQSRPWKHAPPQYTLLKLTWPLILLRIRNHCRIRSLFRTFRQYSPLKMSLEIFSVVHLFKISIWTYIISNCGIAGARCFCEFFEYTFVSRDVIYNLQCCWYLVVSYTCIWNQKSFLKCYCLFGFLYVNWP